MTSLRGLHGFDEAGSFVTRQIDLRGIPRDDAFRIDAEPGQKHEHLLGGGVLRFIEDDEGVVERAAPHEGERRNFDDIPLHIPLALVVLQHVLQGVVKGAEVGSDLLFQIAGEKPELPPLPLQRDG